jgi:hypothetical protein
MTWRRGLLVFAFSVVVAGVAAPFLDADILRGRIQNAVEQGLHRKVAIGKVRFNLFTGPGFTLKDVTIYDDPSVGIEPLAHVDSVQARLRLLSLFSRRLAFSNLRLDEPSINLVKRDDGIWNFQLLLSARTSAPQEPPIEHAPSIQVRGGRLDFKAGDVKSKFYFSDTDVDLDPAADRLDFRFRGEPARNDRPAQMFGRLLFRGSWIRKHSGEPELDLDAELDRSAVDQAVQLIEGHGVGIHGILATRAHISGPLSKLAITGQMQLSDVHRWDLMPAPGSWDLKYRGTLDLWNQRLRLETLPDARSLPLLVRFDASGYLSHPRWAVTLDFREVPSTTLLELARHMGAPFPDTITADGHVSGVVGYASVSGLQGQLRFARTSLELPSADPIAFESADVLVSKDRAAVGPAIVQMPNGQTAELEASYLLASGDVDLRLSTDRMDLAQLHSGTALALGAGSLPMLEYFRQGSWRGSIAFTRAGNAVGEWHAELELQNTRLEVPGFAGPVSVSSGMLSIAGDTFALTRVRGRGGDIPFTAELRSPGRLRIDIAEARPEALEAFFLPTLSRSQSLLSRTLRLGRLTIPEWLRSRRVDANVRINRLAISGDEWTVAKSRLIWDGARIRITGIDAHRENASAMGTIQIDVSGRAPVYTAQGRVENLPYKDGTLSMEGTSTAEGLGADVIATAKGEGTFSGEDISFATDSEFDTVGGDFVLAPGSRVKLTNLQISEGQDTYAGQGSTQADGRLLLELTGSRRQLRLIGTLFAPRPALPE